MLPRPLSAYPRRLVGRLPDLVWATVATLIAWLSLHIKGVSRSLRPYLVDSGAGEVPSAWAYALDASRVLPWSTCLTRSLALCRRLRRQGLAPALRLGSLTGVRFRAHAWVELGGKPAYETRGDYTQFVFSK